MRLLILAEGDAETWDSWSGISRSVVDHLRAAGHTVVCGDAELYGAARYRAALRSVAWPKRRWSVRFRLGPAGFAARSAAAQRALDAHAAQVDAVLQFGATFRVRVPAGLPLALYCDSNFEYSRDGIATGQSEAAALSPAESAGVRAREAEVYGSADLIFTLSERLRSTFVERFGIAPARVRTVLAGANFPIGAEPPVPAVRGDGPPTILFAGRAFLRKGGDRMLDAFAALRRRMPEARLIILGPEQLPGGVVPEGVELLGYVDKSTPEGRARLFDAYARAQVFCLPTRFEAFGIVYLEAMHYELPCIGPRQWAVPEIIADGATGLLVPPEDTAALADALERLLRDPARARAMGLAGKARLRERFTWAHVVRRMTESLAPLVDARR